MHGTVSHGMACKVDRRLNAGYYMFTVGGVAEWLAEIVA